MYWTDEYSSFTSMAHVPIYIYLPSPVTDRVKDKTLTDDDNYYYGDFPLFLGPEVVYRSHRLELPATRTRHE